MKKLLFILIVLWGGGAAALWYWNEIQAQQVTYRTVAARRGDLLATINATGTLEPEEVVDVGAQIAGMVQSFGADPRDPNKAISYGSPVEKGTVLARLDDALLKARVDQARANLARSEADLEQAKAKLHLAERDLDRARRLRSRNSIPEQEYDAAVSNQETSEAAVSVAEGALALAKANLEEASVNLGYATISSPVKGVILDRRVNIGQTVVASLNAPSIFLIAKDLSQMEIWASVNETDVGAIHVGQGVRFTVSAFPRETFRGTVAQVRLNASMTQNVVTYTVVVKVDNAGGKLLPYLTARVEFEVEDRHDALLVPNAALRWQPKAAQVAPERREEFAQALRRRAAAPRRDEATSATKPETKAGTLWVRQGEFVRPVPVTVGLTDGISTEVVEGDVCEGQEVVVGAVAKEADDGGGSPFLPKIKNDKAKK
jgi:HlyD family secretion protein